LSSDPAITTAAVALLTGWGDPLAFLALASDDYAVAVAVVKKAEELRFQRDKGNADYLAAKTGNAILPGLVKTIRRMIRALRG
jgi:hypothetical protein